MNRAIRNPFKDLSDYFCFGCCPSNPFGLHMTFSEEGEEVVCAWKPEPHFQGFEGILHGGIQATLMDELASWFVFSKLGTAGVTARMEIQYHKPVHIGKEHILLRGRLISRIRRIALLHTSLYDADGELCSEAKVEYFLFPAEKAKKEFRYPGAEQFFQE